MRAPFDVELMPNVLTASESCCTKHALLFEAYEYSELAGRAKARLDVA